ncbi:hypothetical protein [Aquimarina sp. 2201CG5-10]|uniref:hypothetical protein n=1 Tax=Aquimarina callyspongiae TaxID=3098150 RepID=UPI002AB493F8|nr:hypothetical protein [Aquimarina sp. 2201CG5-10]MDY8136454.1 hypothetical protein [Aquimarina sp. 2201CG5-10]
MKYVSYSNLSFKNTSYYKRLPIEERNIYDILSLVFHFKINTYVLNHLIRWENVPNDPIYRLTFPRKEMLSSIDHERLSYLIDQGASQKELLLYIQQLKQKMLPKVKHHIAGLPELNNQPIQGMYRSFNTMVSLFPEPMIKTCHTYCSYCFRWIAFNNKQVQDKTSYQDPTTPVAFLTANPEITDVLFTGADPLVLKAETLKRYIDPILNIDSIQTISISSKSLAWWPYRFTTDKDADNILELFRYIQSKGKHLNFCAHFTHVRELETTVVKEATHRIQQTGTVIRCQGPLVKDINDTSQDWMDIWAAQINLGMIPNYMFVEADHNPENCFRIPLSKTLQIFQEAQRQTTGLARTVRGPVFMNDLNRVLLDGITELNGEKYFVLKSLQALPHKQSEGKIKLIPYDQHTKDTGNLFELFNKETDIEKLLI